MQMERISYYNKNIKVNRKALTEVYEILQEYEDDIDEIPEKYMYVIEDNMDRDYIFSTEDLENIELLEDTKKILTYLYTNFLSTPEERTILKQLEKIQYEKSQEQNKISSNVLERKHIKTNNEQQENIDLHPAVVKKENIFTKVIKFIKNLFKR